MKPDPDALGSQVGLKALLKYHFPEKTIKAVGFDEPAFAVDTHVERISKRLGFAKKDDTVNDVERKVCRSIPRDRWNKAHHQFIFFGRYFCKAQNPNCKECHLYDMCKDKIKESKR